MNIEVKIEVEGESSTGEVVISADAEGLEYLAEVCTRLIGKSGPAAHWHLSSDMGTLTKGSLNTVIAFEQCVGIGNDV